MGGWGWERKRLDVSSWSVLPCLATKQLYDFRPGEAPPGSHRRLEEAPQRKDGLESQCSVPDTVDPLPDGSS